MIEGSVKLSGVEDQPAWVALCRLRDRTKSVNAHILRGCGTVEADAIEYAAVEVYNWHYKIEVPFFADDAWYLVVEQPRGRVWAQGLVSQVRPDRGSGQREEPQPAL